MQVKDLFFFSQTLQELMNSIRVSKLSMFLGETLHRLLILAHAPFAKLHPNNIWQQSSSSSWHKTHTVEGDRNASI